MMDEQSTYDSILLHMLEAYAQGASEVTIYTGNEFALKAIKVWSKGWIRKAGPGGVWKNSKGEKIEFQAKIQMILAMERRIHLRLHLVKQEIQNNPLYGKAHMMTVEILFSFLICFHVPISPGSQNEI